MVTCWEQGAGPWDAWVPPHTHTLLKQFKSVRHAVRIMSRVLAAAALILWNPVGGVSWVCRSGQKNTHHKLSVSLTIHLTAKSPELGIVSVNHTNNCIWDTQGVLQRYLTCYSQVGYGFTCSSVAALHMRNPCQHSAGWRMGRKMVALRTFMFFSVEVTCCWATRRHGNGEGTGG